MQVTDVRVRRVEREGKIKAIVSITLDNEFVTHNIKAIEGEKGLFIVMPSHKAVDGEYRGIAHPINSNIRDMVQTTILNKYETTLLENEATEETLTQHISRLQLFRTSDVKIDAKTDLQTSLTLAFAPTFPPS